MFKAAGETTITRKELQKSFGIDYYRLNKYEKRNILNLVSQFYTLNIVEKIEEIDELEKQKKQKTKYDANPIMKIPLISGVFYRSLLKSETGVIFPLTIQQLGIKDQLNINDKLIGFKCTIYNPSNIQEKGVFFSVNDSAWLFENKNLRKKMHHLVLESHPMSNYLITQMLAKIVVPYILDSLKIVYTDVVQLVGIKIPNSSKVVQIGKIENIFSVKHILKRHHFIS